MSESAFHAVDFSNTCKEGWVSSLCSEKYLKCTLGSALRIMKKLVLKTYYVPGPKIRKRNLSLFFIYLANVYSTFRR